MKRLPLLLPAFLVMCGCGMSPPARAPVDVAIQAEAAGGAAAPVKADGPAANASASVRKIIQTARLEVVVADFERAFEGLKGLLAANEVIVSKSEFTGDVGGQRGAAWVLRVPADRFEGFVDGVVALGRPLRRGTESQDVTEEFVDVQARVNNLKREEETLNRLMKEQAHSTAELLQFREQIRQIRGNIESAEGRLNVLSRLTALSTVHLTMHEEHRYAPPPTENAPTFRTAVQSTWDDSLNVLGRCGRAVALVLVALTPWLPVLLPAAAVAAWQVRRRLRSRAGWAG